MLHVLWNLRNVEAQVKNLVVLFLLLLGVSVVACAATPPVLSLPDDVVRSVFAGRHGCLVVINCANGARYQYPTHGTDEQLAPCSTFKIWNTLIGLENGIITSANEPFYTWDGVTRPIPEWNHNLTVQEAFQASCVPAFQALARTIGTVRMQQWIDTLEYGDRNISAGIDVFWLPEKGRTPILISPDAQAQLIVKLVTGKLPCSAHSLAVLKEIMRLKQTAHGTLYGKTGTADPSVEYIGWFVGYVESHGETYAFACLLKEKGAIGKDARAVVEKIFSDQRLL